MPAETEYSQILTLGTGVETGILARPIFATTVTANATTTLTVTSASTQEATGSNQQNYVLPDVTTLVVGWATTFINKSSDIIILTSSSTVDNILRLASGQSVTLICRSISADTTAAAWDVVGLSPALEFTATLGSNQSLTYNTTETLLFQGAVGSMASALDGDYGLFTAPRAGTVLLSGIVFFYKSGGTEYDIRGDVYYSKNGNSSQDLGAAQFTSNWADGTIGVPFNFPLTVAAGDTVVIEGNLQDNAGGATLSALEVSSWTVKYLTP
jgi:hypothetical protein